MLNCAIGPFERRVDPRVVLCAVGDLRHHHCLDLLLLAGGGQQLLGPVIRHTQQAVVVAISLAQHVLGGQGAVRVHGGGFAGTIQAYVPLSMQEKFTAAIERVLGKGTCHTVRVRPMGGAVVV